MKSNSSVSSDALTETEYFNFLFNYAIDNHYSLAVWRLPHANIKYIILSRKTESLEIDTPVETLPSGFIFAPFDREKCRCFFPATYLFSFSQNTLKVGDSPLEISSWLWLKEQIQQFRPKTPTLHLSVFSPVNISKAEYISLVNKCIDEIQLNTFEKVVASRSKVIDLPINFDVVRTFCDLCNIYNNALISFVSSPETGSWLGATPEVLVCIEDESIFKTVALAGTKAFKEGINVKAVAWTQKEIEEQALVERYIISCFKKIRLREYDEHGPKTIVAGNLMHLKSDFTVDLKETNFPQLGSTMLRLLHPTSAVCGMPLQESLQFLKENEGYDREFYAGYLGPVNVGKMIDIYVNLRCMKLGMDHATLYAGAGITSDSIAEEEWEETEIKFNTLLKIIH